MSLGIILEVCMAIYMAAILVELWGRRQWRRFALELGALLSVAALALLVNNAVSGRVSFGEGSSQAGTMGIMFAATVCGIAARFIFYLQEGEFSWLSFFKPMAISPMVLLPLIGSVQTMGEIHGMQVVSFAVLAFQNGFFWETALRSSKVSARSKSAGKAS